ncbi:DUF5689 domain-containing protein [Bacteroides ihuae]|uniref:DUF5689 domain-containing protein n=1 Tax=Bacteroides ihuae TaxID=1852362 RepID=UPI0008D9DF14|nr:DUF5689 domain-containing protein [Bacteroides ihuae]
MNKILKLCMVAVVAFSFAGCYNDFDSPASAKVWTKEDFTNEQMISIKDFKQLFYKDYGNSASSLGKTREITEDYVIHGKVISSDQAGNVYKSVYIYDEESESAIELKLMVSNYVYYHLGQTIFVKTKGLAIGSYRYMLSVGGMPTAADIADGYANRNLSTSLETDAHILPGALGNLTAADTLVVNTTNYKTVLDDNALGRLIRLEGVTYNAGTFDGDKYPQYLETTYPGGSTTAVYTNKYYEDENLTPTYAYSYDGQRYYGSSWFSYDKTSTTTSGNYILRVSGYANFALQPLPANGTMGDITAIYTKYSSKSGGYIKYQLLVNSLNDIGFKTESEK